MVTVDKKWKGLLWLKKKGLFWPVLGYEIPDADACYSEKKRVEQKWSQVSVRQRAYLAFDVHAESIREFKGVEECISNDGGAIVGTAHFPEATDHLGP